MRKRKVNPIIILISIYFVTFLFISAAYSFFNENLELKGISSIVSTKNYQYTFINNNTWSEGSYKIYHYTATITYLGDEEYTSWQVNVKVPSGTEIVGCYNASECIVTGDILKIKNASWNGIVSKNQNTFTFSFQMKTMVSNYDFVIESIHFFNSNEPGDPGGNNGENPDDKIDNFKVNILRDNYWGNTTQFSISIDNNSNISLTSWSLVLNVPTGSTISNCWGASYILKEDTIILSGPSWNVGLNSKSSVTGIGLQLTTPSVAPAKINIHSLKGVTTNYEDVEMNV